MKDKTRKDIIIIISYIALVIFALVNFSKIIVLIVLMCYTKCTKKERFY